ncbi:MAG: zeta toxin family protein [Planctomycetes bacterium]|nr:zeta toxin family protein [Planctomycetota bacterium]
MAAKTPKLIVLAGPNGAGKSTLAPALLHDVLSVTQFVNADVIAEGLAGFDPASAAFEAGRIMLERLDELARHRVDFAFETTLAARSHAPRLSQLIQQGYHVHLVYLWLSSASAAVKRVANRVRLGGHDVPEETIRRRYEAGLKNFFGIYQPLAMSWRMYNASSIRRLRVIASGRHEVADQVDDPVLWDRIKGAYAHGD